MAALDLSSLKSYVSGGALRSVSSGTLLLDVQHSLIAQRFVEIPFDVHSSLDAVKDKIHSLCGTAPHYQQLYLDGPNGTLLSSRRCHQPGHRPVRLRAVPGLLRPEGRNQQQRPAAALPVRGGHGPLRPGAQRRSARREPGGQVRHERRGVRQEGQHVPRIQGEAEAAGPQLAVALPAEGRAAEEAAAGAAAASRRRGGQPGCSAAACPRWQPLSDPAG